MIFIVGVGFNLSRAQAPTSGPSTTAPATREASKTYIFRGHTITYPGSWQLREKGGGAPTAMDIVSSAMWVMARMRIACVSVNAGGISECADVIEVKSSVTCGVAARAARPDKEVDQIKGSVR